MPESLEDYSLSKQVGQGKDGGLQKVGLVGAGNISIKSGPLSTGIAVVDIKT